MTVPSIAAFRALHASGCFVLPNPWDAGSARYLAGLGFKALATTSAGFAFTKGLPDSMSAIPVELMLAHVRELAAATPLPLNADFQSGYAPDPEGVAANVAHCVDAGAAGLSIEDASGDPAAPLFDRVAAIDLVRAARVAIDRGASGAVLTARCEAWLVSDLNPVRTPLDRLVDYDDASAECLFAPAVK